MTEPKSFFEFIRTKTFFKHLGIASVVGILIIIGLLQFLSSFTEHGQSVDVPDFKGKNIAGLNNFIADKPFRYMITDSVFVNDKPKGTVLEQTPAPGFKVKENRTIYLTVNAMNPPKIKMPNLVDASLRQALSLLETYGLKPGKIEYKPDFAKNAVLEQHYKGKKIEAGKDLPHGATIDLVLGDGLGDEEVKVPFLVGLCRKDALSELSTASLTVGSEVFDESVKDSSKAKIYRQIPVCSSKKINMGRPIDLFYTQDESKIKKDTANVSHD